MADTPRIRIEYCVPCSARPYATNLLARLLEEHENEVAAVDVVMGDKGIFDVHVDDVLPLVRAQLAS